MPKLILQKTKGVLLGIRKSVKKISPGDNLFYSFCISNFIPTNLLSLMLTKEKRKTYASSREKSEVRNAEIYGLASSSKNKKNSTGNLKAAGKQRFSIILKDGSDSS